MFIEDDLGFLYNIEMIVEIGDFQELKKEQLDKLNTGLYINKHLDKAFILKIKRGKDEGAVAIFKSEENIMKVLEQVKGYKNFN